LSLSFFVSLSLFIKLPTPPLVLSTGVPQPHLPLHHYVRAHIYIYYVYFAARRCGMAKRAVRTVCTTNSRRRTSTTSG
jgi:hypothetical protein